MTDSIPTVFDDGLLRFSIRNAASGESAEHSIDVLILKLTCEECVEAHKLQTNERNQYIVTATFLNDLAARIQALGIPGVTASVAFQLWVAATTNVEALKKNTSETPSSDSGSTSSPENQLPEPVRSDY